MDYKQIYEGKEGSRFGMTSFVLNLKIILGDYLIDKDSPRQ